MEQQDSALKAKIEKALATVDGLLARSLVSGWKHDGEPFHIEIVLYEVLNEDPGFDISAWLKEFVSQKTKRETILIQSGFSK